MSNITVSLTEQLKSWAESQADTGRYEDASDYIRDLIRRDRIRAAKIARMQDLVTEGLESGISTRTMEDIERDVLARIDGDAAAGKI